MELSVVIPCYNEDTRIEATLEHTISYLQAKGIDYEIIVVDDGCFDNTRNVVEKFTKQKVKITNKRKNRGKGYSVKQGMLLADKKYILFMDADNSTRIDEIEQFMEHVDSQDIIIASRNLPESILPIKQPFIRSCLGKLFPLFVRLLVVRGIKDTQCGFKLFKRPVAQRLLRLQTLNRFAFDVELLFLASQKGYHIKELPVTWRNDERSTVRLFTPLKMFVSLFTIRFNQLMGRYDERH